MAVNAQQQQPPPDVEFSDEDDLRLFESRYGDFDDFDLAGEIIGVERNDPKVTYLAVKTREMGEAAAGRLGEIIGQSIYLKHVIFRPKGVDVEPMCAGLQRNRSIQQVEFVEVDLGDAGRMNRLAPFLRHNPSLKSIHLEYCDIGPASFDVLSGALSGRSGNTLEELHLTGNPIGDIGLEGLFQALDGGTRLRKLDLAFCGLGRRACISLAKLLGNPEGKLTVLYVNENSIDDESAVALAGSLANNKKLVVLDLNGNYDIEADGWSVLLQLLCNTQSIDGVIRSNHVLSPLCSNGLDGASNTEAFIKALGEDNANLLNASISINHKHPSEFEKNLVVRQKLIWGHVRGDLNLGTALVRGDLNLGTAPDNIYAGAMPCILAWFGNNSDESDAGLRDPPLAPTDTRKAKLGAIFRILRTRPDLCSFRGAISDARRTAEAAIGALCAMDDSILNLLAPGKLKEKVAQIQKMCREIDGPGNDIGAKRCRV